MKTATEQHKIQTGLEPIPGYRIIRKLGAGGYGEVWSAEAPGGLEKAIKFVYGSHDSQHGARELKSLNRIKGINHPFLLSLERFEIIDRQLIIITELASGSLEDVLEQHIERGSCGIPKGELLGYLHDAADGLDYLHEEFQLQHLDVKPGNLMLVGGHVKVGDFGLLKDLGDIECSMVGGLTPIYAAPEVFDGKPHNNSDQYALAIMYQELLTGKRPFAGRTIAQLATQHIHSAPNLDALPPADRPIIARALEKDPTRRFDNCRELINRLKRTADDSVTAPQVISPRNRAIDETNVYSPAEQRKVDNLPSVNTRAATNVQPTQALVLGLGGVGRSVVEKLCLRQSNANTACDLRSILIDTDDASIYGFREYEIENNLICNVQRVCFPLKTPHDYREQSEQRLASISRRWIYNAPKTHRTEGLRPLGRLALLDHATHLKRILEDSVAGLSVDGSTGIPSFYVVSSLLGGTGSGMLYDAAFMLRQILDDHGLAEAEIRPILLACDPDESGQDVLPVASMHAALKELRFFLSPTGGYPEDKANGIQSVPAARSPVQDAYCVFADENDDAIEGMCSYIWNDAFVSTPYFSLGRKRTGESESVLKKRSVRSFGIAPLMVHPKVDSTAVCKRAVDLTIRRWMGDPNSKSPSVERDAIEVLDLIGVSPQGWADMQLHDLIGDNVQRWREGLEQDIKDEMTRLDHTETLIAKEAVVHGRAKVQSLVARAAKSNEQTQMLEAKIETALEALSEFIAKNLQNKRFNMFQAVELLRQLHKQCFAYAQQNERAIADMKQQADQTFHAMMNDLTHRPVDQVDIPSITGSLISLMRSDLQKPNGIYFEEFGDKVKLIEAKLLASAKEIARIHALHLKTAGEATPQDSEVESKVMPRISEHLHAQYADALLSGSIASNKKSQKTTEQWVKTLSEETVGIADSILNDTSGNGLVSKSQLKNNIQDALTASKPGLLRYGGGQRVMLLGDDLAQLESLKPMVEELLGFEISIAESTSSETILVNEASEISLDELLNDLSERLGENLAIADRLLSRCDINW